jgi:replicative DNA helicase
MTEKKTFFDYQLESMSPEEAKKIAEKVDNKLFGAQQENPEKLELIAVGELEEEAQELIKNWGKMQGISTGIKRVDYNMRGLVPGELIILAGETSHGKTALGVNIAVNVAKQNKAVLFVTLEITQAQLTARIGKILDDPKDLTQLPVLMQKYDGDLDWKDIKKLVKVAKEEGAELIIIDHLHYFTREVDRMAEELGRITKQFKRAAIENKVPVILISHVRKKEGSKKPEMSNDALRGSSLIAQDADVVLFVHKTGEDKLMVKTTKNRNRGYDFERDTVELDFIEGAIIRDPKIADPWKDAK